MLYNVLLSVHVVFDHENAWKLQSANKFEADIIEKARKELEDNLERVAGRKIGLTVGHGEAAKSSPVQEEDPDLPPEPAEVVEIEDGESDGFAPETAPVKPAANTAPAAKAAPAAPGGADDMKWEDMSSRTPEEEPELKHLNKVFHGRITRIQKIK